MFNYVGTIDSKVNDLKEGVETTVRQAVGQMVHSIKYPASYKVVKRTTSPLLNVTNFAALSAFDTYSLVSKDGSKVIENVSGDEKVILGEFEFGVDALGNLKTANKVEFTAGVDVYNIVIPTVSTAPVKAAVLTLPGIVVQYNIGDVVLVGEIEDRSPGGFFYIILGKIQKQIDLTDPIASSIGRLIVDDIQIKNGTIDCDVKVLSSNREGLISTPAQDVSLRTIWNNSSTITDLTSSFNSLSSSFQLLKTGLDNTLSNT